MIGTYVNKMVLASKVTRKELRATLLEFVGVTLFALFGGSANGPVAAAANGLLLATLVYALDGIMANPVVTLSALITGHIKKRVALLFTGAQILGGFVGVGIQTALLPDVRNSHAGCFQPAPGISKAQLFGWETLATFMLVMVVQSIALRSEQFSNLHISLRESSGPLAIGVTLFASALVMGPLTGAALNPARVIAPAAVYQCTSSGVTEVYIAAQIVGSVLASVLALLVFYKPELFEPVAIEEEEEHVVEA